jgi:hypothetical protein
VTDCTQCSATLKPQAKFCTGCGATVTPPTPVCPACGVELRAGARFCTSCGATLDAPQEARAAAPAVCDAEPRSLLAKEFAHLGVGGVLIVVAAVLMIVSVTKPWFTMVGLGDLGWNEGYVLTTGYETFKPSSPVSADIGYFAVILGAASVILSLLSSFDAAPEWDNALDKAWLKVVGHYFADRGCCLLVLAAVILRFVTRQDGTEYAIGIYLFLVAAILLTMGSIMTRAQMTAQTQTALAEQGES